MLFFALFVYLQERDTTLAIDFLLSNRLDRKGVNVVKRFFFLLISCVLIFSSFVIAYALTLPNSVVENGNTYLRTFNIKDLTADQQNYFESVISSDTSVVLLLDSGDYSFFIVPAGCSLTITNDDEFLDCVNIWVSPTKSARFLDFSYDNISDTFNLSSDTLEAYGQFRVKSIAGGQFWSTVSYNFPSLSFDYIADVTGKLIIEWNTQGESGDNWWTGVLDWLGSFWQKFIDTLKGLFVPRDGYFQNFFNEIKSAFEKKLGGLGDILSSISSAFSSLKNYSASSSLIIHLPDNQFFQGYDGLSVDVLKPVSTLLLFIRGVFNSFIVVVTAIICYKKLIFTVRG